MKKTVNSFLRKFGYEICRLSPSEASELDHTVNMNYKEAQIFRAITASGQISIEESRFLFELVRQSDPSRPIVEVGTLYGASTLIICLAKSPKQKLYAVDNFSWNSLGISSSVHFAATKKRLQECINNFEVELINKPASEFYSSYDDLPPALFFCDADHNYDAVHKDITWAKDHRSSIICGDDYEPKHTGVTRAVNDFGGPTELHGGLWKL